MTSKSDIVEERKANLPLPEGPPVASDFNSADASTVNVGSGSLSGGNEAREPVTAPNTSNTGRQGVDNLDGVPNDAVTREKKGHSTTTETTGKDYGYPQESDPARGPK